MTAATLRPCGPDDLATVARIWYETWHATFPERQHPHDLQQREAVIRDEVWGSETIIVAEREGEIAGFMAIRELEGYVHLLYVLPRHHGTGTGVQLLAEAMRRCPDGLSLTTDQENLHARAFYEHHGFVAGATGHHRRTGSPNIAYHWRRDPAHLPTN